jgi:hypothetical protein
MDDPRIQRELAGIKSLYLSSVASTEVRLERLEPIEGFRASRDGACTISEGARREGKSWIRSTNSCSWAQVVVRCEGFGRALQFISHV